jgi:splicing factor 3B subunit 3
VRLLRPDSGRGSVARLGEDELALAGCLVRLGAAQEEFLAVGCCTGLELHPQQHRSACVKLFRLAAGRLTLVHSTPVDGGLPRALCALGGGLLAVGVGASVKVLSLGQSKLLLKAELSRAVPTQVCWLKAHGQRVYCGDARESITILRFSHHDLSLQSFADDSVPRACVAGEVLDYDTVAGSDKFGNMFVLRLPSDVGDADVDDNGGGGDRMLWDQARQAGAPNKLDQLAHYYVGELVTAMHKAALVPGKAEALLFCTVQGSVAAAVPFASKGDLEFFSLLEMHMRAGAAALTTELVAREHLPYRSYFAPVKNVVDGDLCRLFDSLPPATQHEIAKELGRTPQEVSKKIGDMETCIL